MPQHPSRRHGRRDRLPTRLGQRRRTGRDRQVPQHAARRGGRRRRVPAFQGLRRGRRGRLEGQVSRYGAGHAGGRGRLPDPVHAGARARDPARGHLRDGEVGAQTRVLHGAGHRGAVAQRERGHPDRSRWLYGQHRRLRDEYPAVPGAGERRALVPREQGRGARPYDREGLWGVKPDRDQRDRRRSPTEPARGAPPVTVSSPRVGAHPGRIGLVAAVLALGAGRLIAQHAGQFEVGAFGSYTKYDPTFGLPTKIGGGARLGYLFGNVLGVEGDLLFQQEYNVVPASGTPQSLQPLIGSASLVVNALHTERLMVYVLGGYTVLDFGTRAPYKFTDNAAHAGGGVRLFLTNRIALRVEGREIGRASCRERG